MADVIIHVLLIMNRMEVEGYSYVMNGDTILMRL